MKFVKSLFAVAAMMLMAVGAARASDAELGPAVGETIPHDLAVAGQPGFDALKGENGLVLFFVRSVDWCPYCKNQVINISGEAVAFEERGYNVAYLSYDAPAKQAKFQDRREIAGAFISDENSEVIDAFGLRNENHEEGSFGYGIPHPAVFIIGSDSTVQGKLYEEEYKSDRKSYQNRPAAEIILAEIDKVSG
jgi:peroxiredoxin